MPNNYIFIIIKVNLMLSGYVRYIKVIIIAGANNAKIGNANTNHFDISKIAISIDKITIIQGLKREIDTKVLNF